MDMRNVKRVTIPEGAVKRIKKGNDILWEEEVPKPVFAKLTYNDTSASVTGLASALSISWYVVGGTKPSGETYPAGTEVVFNTKRPANDRHVNCTIWVNGVQVHDNQGGSKSYRFKLERDTQITLSLGAVPHREFVKAEIRD